MSIKYSIGIDEVGRGPLAGPVTICACRIGFDFDLSKFSNIRDSKKLSPKKREEWFNKISEMKNNGEIDFVFTSIEAKDIDSFGIAPSIQKALDTSLEKLDIIPEEVEILLDGSLKAPKKFIKQEAIIKGDEKISVISAASIVAKVMRDRYMDEQAKIYKEYGFDKHKGYGTAVHIKAIKKHGPSPLHRRSFLKNIL